MSTNKKYSLTNNTKIARNGTTLFQIKAEMSFGTVVKGELGGYIEAEKNLSMSGNAWVYGDAQVYGNAWVSGNAQVYGNARVSGNAWVYGNAWVSGNARVYGDAQVYGDARVSAKASFTLGWFIGGDDSGKITDITEKTGSTYWNNQYVLGDYEITPIEDEKKETIKIGNQTYNKAEVENALKNVKSL